MSFLNFEDFLNENMKEIKPTDKNPEVINISIFLAGSIEMGKAEDWQSKVCKHFDNSEFDITFFNPRRDSWDSSWKQEQSETNFNQQVNWELNRLQSSHIIFMYFDPKTMSPISLLELGYFAQSGKMIVCCPEGFWRRGNVEIMCTRNNIPFYDNLDVAIGSLETRIRQLLNL